MFVAFPLYVVHAVLTGLSLAIAYLLDIHLGFSFSAGLIDLLLYGTAPAAKNVWLLIVMGAGLLRRLLRAVPPGDPVVEPADPRSRAATTSSRPSRPPISTDEHGAAVLGGAAGATRPRRPPTPRPSG